MSKINFLHCADLHLGCTPNHLDIRYEDFFISFKNLIDNDKGFICILYTNKAFLIIPLILLLQCFLHGQKYVQVREAYQQGVDLSLNSVMKFLSGATLKILESATLPLGILESLRPVTASHVLIENDVLLFLSDGITSAFPSTTDLYEVLKVLPSSNPQLLAEELLQKAVEGYGGKAMDDMTVLAVRLYAA